jgi:hypothetical protein
VQPVELARKLVKEMEDHKVISVSRVYAPNEYTIYLAPSDREQFASYEDSLRSELQEYIAENARRERYELLSPPEVKFETDDDLEMGEFGIATRMVQGAVPQPGEPQPQPLPGATMVYRKHAEVRQEGAAYWAVDLDSTNGMEVNGRRQKRAKLRQGDRITLGSTELVFKRETETDE